jgi:hypothetical protein
VVSVFFGIVHHSAWILWWLVSIAAVDCKTYVHPASRGDEVEGGSPSKKQAVVS